MKSCSSAYCVLIVVMVTAVEVSESAVSVTVKVNDRATLPCSQSCSGKVAKWTPSSNPRDTLAECDQTSCRSVKEGYLMIHDQYLKGDLSLIITKADYSKRGRYTCECGTSEINDVELQVVESELAITVWVNDPATLPCYKTCTGGGRWTVSSNPSDSLAECDQTSCRSVKEGYQMIHDQYLNGDLSLIITKADLSKRGVYTCYCDKTKIRGVELQVVALSSVPLISGESLELEVDVSVPVEVMYNREGGSSRVLICTVDGGSVQCKAEYTQRVSLTSSVLTLRGMKTSDSGDYIIRETSTKREIHTYLVTVRDPPPLPVWVIVLVELLVVMVVILVGFCLLVRCSQRFRRWLRSKLDDRTF